MSEKLWDGGMVPSIDAAKLTVRPTASALLSQKVQNPSQSWDSVTLGVISMHRSITYSARDVSPVSVRVPRRVRVLGARRCGRANSGGHCCRWRRAWHGHSRDAHGERAPNAAPMRITSAFPALRFRVVSPSFFLQLSACCHSLLRPWPLFHVRTQVDDVADLAGPDTQLPTIDVATQSDGPPLTLRQWANYWRAPSKAALFSRFLRAV